MRERRTTETVVRVEVFDRQQESADGPNTTVPFLDHMMTVLAKYSGIRSRDRVPQGDLRHHIIEDVALTVGAGDRGVRCRRLQRATANALVPMDEAVGASGARRRRSPLLRGADPEQSLYDHWMRSFCDSGRFTLHLLRDPRRATVTHIIEAAFKALGFALRQSAVDSGAVFSTKGAVTLEGA